MIEGKLGIPKKITQHTSKEDLKKKKACPCFVPHHSITEQHEQCVAACKELLLPLIKSISFQQSLLAMGVGSLFMIQIASAKVPSGRKLLYSAEETLFQKSWVKTILIIF